MKRLIVRGIGYTLFAVGGLGVGFGILAIIDPVGSKMADDGDPFGVPPSISESALITLIYASVWATGYLMLRKTASRRAA